MIICSRFAVTAIVACGLALSLGHLVAQAQSASSTFEVTRRDGQTVSSTALAPAGRWLLAYVFPGSAPSDRLVQALGESLTPDRASRLVLIVAGDAERALPYLTEKGGAPLASTTWYTDPGGDAWRALGFEGTLGVAGMVGSTPEWKVDGVIADPSAVEPVAHAWLDVGTGPVP